MAKLTDRNLINIKRVLLIIGILIISSRFLHIFYMNVGWMLLNRGIALNIHDSLQKGETILSRIYGKQHHYTYLFDAYFDPENQLRNGSFEFSQDWVIQGADGVMVQISDEESYQGDRSLHLDFQGKDVNFYQVFQEVTVMPAACYQLQAQIKADTGPVAIEIWDAEMGFEHWYGGHTRIINKTIGWEPIEFQFCTGDNIYKIQIRIRRYDGQNEVPIGDVWVDAVKLFGLE